MDISIENCNNIQSGSIHISESKLNIKFGINGTGKSTIAKAIRYELESPDKLTELTPFRLQKQTDLKPKVCIPQEIKTVFIFNEEYLSQFLYKEDELISNSFEIFIKTPNYIESIKKIEDILENIKKVFSEKKELEQIISDFDSLSKSFTMTSKGELSKSSALHHQRCFLNRREGLGFKLKYEASLSTIIHPNQP
jgi:hypothetical protein